MTCHHLLPQFESSLLSVKHHFRFVAVAQVRAQLSQRSNCASSTTYAVDLLSRSHSTHRAVLKAPSWTRFSRDPGLSCSHRVHLNLDFRASPYTYIAPTGSTPVGPHCRQGMKTITLLSAIAALSTVTSATPTYTLLHRITSFTSTPDWSPRATLNLDANTTTLTNLLTGAQVESLQQQARSEDAKDLFYQVALQPEGGKEQLWTSVKLCHLRQSHQGLTDIDDELTLTVRSGDVVGLGYRIRDITLDASSCPVTTSTKLNKIAAEKRRQRQRQLSRRRSGKPASPPAPTPPAEAVFSTTIRQLTGTKASKLQLKQAAPTNEDGTIVQPPPEKSFLQKYWMYLIPVVLLLIMPDGSDDGKDQGAEGHASSEHRGTGMGAKRLK